MCKHFYSPEGVPSFEGNVFGTSVRNEAELMNTRVLNKTQLYYKVHYE